MASLFTEIINGKASGFKIHEDEHTYSLLAPDQVNLGHCLVVPKQEFDLWHEIPEEIYLQMTRNSQKVSKAIQQATGCPRVANVIMGFVVRHCHIHLIPAWSMAEVDFKLQKRRPDHEMKQIQDKILNFLK